MGRRQIGALVAVGALALMSAATARAEIQARLVVRETSGGGQLKGRFDLVGLHWRGAGALRFRTRSVEGGWSAWRSADVDEHTDIGSGEAGRTRGWRVSEPYWVGLSDRIEWRGSRKVRRVRAYLVLSPGVGAPLRTLDLTGSPGIVMRSAWGADEELRRGGPRYAPRVRFAVVHHTAGTNVYYPEDSAAIVRAIAVYHVQGNGWNDIGYNFLVDRYGQVFEGRYGGVARNVIGAHSAGFNTGSVGVAVLGTYGRRPISAAARAALTRLLAWRLDIAHVDPSSTLTWASGGNSKYPPGTPIVLRAVSGHRDTALTECPGASLYTELPAIASTVALTGLPKLYDVTVRGTVGGFISFSGRLSSPQPWTISVRDTAGARVASSAGTGAEIRWTWDARTVQPTAYAWSIDAPSVRPAKGTVGAAPTPIPPRQLPPVLSEFTFSPAAISPDGDGYADFATVTYRLRRSALVTARVIGEGAAAAPATLFQDQRQSARVQSWVWSGDSVPDGRYVFEVTARGADGVAVQATAPVLVDRTLGFLRVEPASFSPNGDGKDDTIAFSFDLGSPAAVKVQVAQYGREIVPIYAGELQPGPQRFVWNGQAMNGVVPPGQYDLVVTAVDALAQSAQRLRFTVAAQ